MKISSPVFPGRALGTPKGQFASYFKAAPPGMKLAPPPLVPRPLVRATPAHAVKQIFSGQEKTVLTHVPTAEATLTTARAAAHAQASQLVEARVEQRQVATGRHEGRLIDLICRELVIEFSGEPKQSRVANQDLPLAPPTPGLQLAPVATGSAPKPVEPAVRVAQTVELIEKIETFVKDSRTPCLALTLNNSLGAKVEIERVGPREVALKVFGHRGPPRAEDIGRIRDEMRAHGLKVCALSVA